MSKESLPELSGQQWILLIIRLLKEKGRTYVDFGPSSGDGAPVLQSSTEFAQPNRIECLETDGVRLEMCVAVKRPHRKEESHTTIGLSGCDDEDFTSLFLEAYRRLRSPEDPEPTEWISARLADIEKEKVAVIKNIAKLLEKYGKKGTIHICKEVLFDSESPYAEEEPFLLVDALLEEGKVTAVYYSTETSLTREFLRDMSERDARTVARAVFEPLFNKTLKELRQKGKARQAGAILQEPDYPETAERLEALLREKHDCGNPLAAAIADASSEGLDPRHAAAWLRIQEER